MATILEALQNAKYNLTENKYLAVAATIGVEQLTNAVTLLEKGYSLETEVEPLLELFGTADSVPDYDEDR